MNYDNLPTDDLKEFGIIGADNTFSKKLSNDDIQKFLKGESLVADNGKDRVVFQMKIHALKSIFFKEIELFRIFLMKPKKAFLIPLLKRKIVPMIF